jgi:uncharacterized protein (TIGR00297 family)
MTLAESAGLAFAVTAVLAVAARLVGALTTGGAVAGAIVGACVSAGFGLPGLAVLGTFFVVGTLATRIGWKTKQARGTAEPGEGRRDWKRVLGKGGVAAIVTLAYVLLAVTTDPPPNGTYHLPIVFLAAVAAALADTLGTEIGTLSSSEPRMLPSLRRVAPGTPGAVSAQGLAGAVAGALLVAAAAMLASRWSASPEPGEVPIPRYPFDVGPLSWTGFAGIATAGFLASVVESLAVGLGLRASGFVRNILTTAAGALFGAALWPIRGLLV